MPPRFQLRRQSQRLRALGLLCVVATTGCAHYAVRPTPTALREPIVRNESGVSLAMAQPADAMAAFDADLRRRGVFPVLLHLENRAGTSVTIARESMRLSSAAGVHRQLSSSDVAERLQYSPMARYFAWSFGLFGIGMIPGIVDYFRAETANRAIWDDIARKRLASVSVRSGDVMSGFVFFDVARSVQAEELETTVVTADGQTLRYVLRLQSATRP